MFTYLMNSPGEEQTRDRRLAVDRGSKVYRVKGITASAVYGMHETHSLHTAVNNSQQCMVCIQVSRFGLAVRR